LGSRLTGHLKKADVIHILCACANDCSGIFSSILERLNVKEENVANTVLWTGTVFCDSTSLKTHRLSRKRSYTDGCWID